MIRVLTVLALLASIPAPAMAGGDWDDDDYSYDHYRPWRGDYRAYYGVPAYSVPAYEVYIPYGYYFSDEPTYYGPNCEVKRKWKHGYVKEKVKCDDD